MYNFDSNDFGISTKGKLSMGGCGCAAFLYWLFGVVLSLAILGFLGWAIFTLVTNVS